MAQDRVIPSSASAAEKLLSWFPVKFTTLRPQFSRSVSYSRKLDCIWTDLILVPW